MEALADNLLITFHASLKSISHLGSLVNNIEGSEASETETSPQNTRIHLLPNDPKESLKT